MSYTNGLDNPHLYFQCKLYTGNSTDDTSITLDGDENMSPNLVWLKRRDAAGRNRLFDTVRGATKSMRSDDGESEIRNFLSKKGINFMQIDLMFNYNNNYYCAEVKTQEKYFLLPQHTTKT